MSYTGKVTIITEEDYNMLRELLQREQILTRDATVRKACERIEQAFYQTRDSATDRIPDSTLEVNINFRVTCVVI